MEKPISQVEDPFASQRREQGVMQCPIGGETITMILRHGDVRRAARDIETYSSNAPQRVPIPSEENVRTVRQLPIETDPPQHTEYKKLVQPFFNRPRTPDVEARVLGLVREALLEALRRDSVEIVREFALPLQSRALTCLLGMPMSEADRWTKWGTHVFRDKGADGTKRGTELEIYIQRQIERALTEPDDDFFSALCQSEYRGRKLTREEVAGYANLAFAGGRDTVITIVSSAIAWLAEHPQDLQALRADSRLVASATEEFIRYFSPLTQIGRVCPHGAQVHGVSVADNDRIGLCWASANRDETVFEAPDEVRIDRMPNPHVGFGFGKHACLGATQARLIMRTLLSELAARVSSIELLDAEANWETEHNFRRQVGFDYLNVRFNP